PCSSCGPAARASPKRSKFRSANLCPRRAARTRQPARARTARHSRPSLLLAPVLSDGCSRELSPDATSPPRRSAARSSPVAYTHPTPCKAAVFQLATNIPAPILAELLGLGTNTAVRWATLAARDWSGYAAARRPSGARRLVATD